MSREKIFSLQAALEAAKLELFTERLNKIEPIPATCSQITFHMESPCKYRITYEYRPSTPDTSGVDGLGRTSAQAAPTTVVFARERQYTLMGSGEYAVYRNSAGTLRVKEANSTVDISDMQSRMILHSVNEDLAESYMLRVIRYFNDNKWDDEAIYVHFSVV